MSNIWFNIITAVIILSGVGIVTAFFVKDIRKAKRDKENGQY